MEPANVVVTCVAVLAKLKRFSRDVQKIRPVSHDRIDLGASNSSGHWVEALQFPFLTQSGHWQSEFAVTHNFTDAGEVARPLPRLCAPQDT